MKKKSCYLFLICCLFATKFYGQQQPITIGYQKSAANDSIWVNITTAADTKPGTLMLVTKASVGFKSDTAYFPIINASSDFVLLIPEGSRTGYLQLKAFFYPKIFEVTGRILDKAKNKKVNALIITDNQRIFNKEVEIAADNSFALPSLVFNTKASLIFNYVESNDKNHPDVMIQEFPTANSFTTPLSIDTIALSIPPPVAAVNNAAPKAVPVDFSKFPTSDSTDKIKTLSSVVVVGKKKSNAEKYNELYSTPMFQDINEKVVDIMDDPSAQSYPDCLSYLQSRVPGIMPSTDKFGESILKWRGHETKAFFIDEIAVDIDQLLSVSVNDIAIIKAFPPPYTMAMNGDGGAIAIYTKRGEFRTPNTVDNKWLYLLKGYSPAIHTLFSAK
jgi:hypothetical protein